MGVGFDHHGEAHEPVVRAIPAAGLLLECRQRLIETQRMARITRRAAAQLLGVDLPDAEIALRLDRRLDQVRRRGRDRVIERAGGAGREHLHAGERARHAHRLLAQVERERQQELRHPVFQQVAVGQPLEQRVPVMLVHVDEAGQHDCAARVDHLVERVALGRLRRRADCRDAGAVDRDVTIRKDIAPGIDGDDVAVGDQCAGHSVDPCGAQSSSVPARKRGFLRNDQVV